MESGNCMIVFLHEIVLIDYAKQNNEHIVYSTLPNVMLSCSKCGPSQKGQKLIIVCLT